MATVYRNNANLDRTSTIARADKIAEAGEVFTPAEAIGQMLANPEVARLAAGNDLILEPSCGDGNFLVNLYNARLKNRTDFEDAFLALENVYGVEIQEDNVLVARSRCEALVKEHFPKLSSDELARLHAMVESRIVAGDFLTGKHCSLECARECKIHGEIKLPERFALTIGNPPYNPGKMYHQFVLKSLTFSDHVMFIIPTAWKLSDAHKVFRGEIANVLSEITDLPWHTFAIKMRTCIVMFSANSSGHDFVLNGEPGSFVTGDLKVCNTVLAKAYHRWPASLNDYKKPTHKNNYPLFLGWKCNLERDRRRVNALQSIATDSADSRLPNNTYAFAFSTAEQRRNYVAYTSTKLAAYFQSLTDSDTVNRHLPVPDLEAWPAHCYSNDHFLYEALGLNPTEIKHVEAYKVFISAKAKSLYDELAIVVRQDALIGKPRKACTACGSSSFHKKGCENSTEKERDTRDRGL